MFIILSIKNYDNIKDKIFKNILLIFNIPVKTQLTNNIIIVVKIKNTIFFNKNFYF
jgi:hypothetical protein